MESRDWPRTQNARSSRHSLLPSKSHLPPFPDHPYSLRSPSSTLESISTKPTSSLHPSSSPTPTSGPRPVLQEEEDGKTRADWRWFHKTKWPGQDSRGGRGAGTHCLPRTYSFAEFLLQYLPRLLSTYRWLPLPARTTIVGNELDFSWEKPVRRHPEQNR